MKRLMAALAGILWATVATSAWARPIDWNDLSASSWRFLDEHGRPEPEVRIRMDGYGIEYRDPCYMRGHGVYSEAGRLKIGQAGARSSCESPTDRDVQRLARFERAIETATAARLDGDRLTLIDASGRVVLGFRWIRPSGFENRPWRISAYADNGRLVEPPRVRRDISDPSRFAPWSGPTVSFSDGTFSGRALCTGLNGSYRRDGDWIELRGGLYILGGFCFPENEEFDAVLRALFSGRGGLRPHGDGWLLTDEAGATKAVLVPTTSVRSPLQPRDEPDIRNALVGHRWRIVRSETSGGPATSRVKGAPAPPSVWFASNGHLEVTSTCATLGGHYVLGGSSLYMTGNWVWNRGCPLPVEPQPMLASLKRVRSVEVTGRRARLLDESDRPIFELERLPDQARARTP